MLRSSIIIMIVVLFSSSCFAQDSEQQLYDAYLTTNMHVWAEYIDSVNWNTATTDERFLILNYEYGYAAHAISIQQEDAQERLQQFEQHLEEHRNAMDPAVYYTYKTGICSFKLSLERRHITQQIKGIYHYIDSAMTINPNEPFVLTMKGNVEFFNPIFGSKQKALQFYQKADSLYRLQPAQHQYPRWNHRALQITLVQSLGKTGQKEAAIEMCQQILAEEPNFPFIRDIYLPSLLKKEGK